VLLRTAPTDPGRWRAAEDRTRDELRVMGLGVVEVERREDPAALERVLAEHGALVAVHVARAGDRGGAEMWWVDPASGALRSAQLEGLASEGPAAAALTALRAAELVRAQTSRAPGPEDRSWSGAPTPDPRAPAATPRSGPEDRSSAAPRSSAPAPPLAGPADRSPRVARVPDAAGAVAPGEGAPFPIIDPLDFVVPATPPAPLAPDTREPGDRAVGISTGLTGGPGGAGPLVGGGLALRWHLTRALAIQGEAQGAASATWLEGQAQRFRVGLAGARLALVFVARPAATLSWRLGLGGGATLAWARARSADALRSSRDRRVVGVLRANVHAAIRVRPRLRVVVGLDLELLTPPIAVWVQDVEVARLGTPLVRGVLGLEWDWRSRARR